MKHRMAPQIFKNRDAGSPTFNPPPLFSGYFNARMEALIGRRMLQRIRGTTFLFTKLSILPRHLKTSILSASLRELLHSNRSLDRKRPTMSDPYIAKNKFNIKLARFEAFMSYKILSERKYLKSAKNLNASHADNSGLKRFETYGCPHRSKASE